MHTSHFLPLFPSVILTLPLLLRVLTLVVSFWCVTDNAVVSHQYVEFFTERQMMFTFIFSSTSAQGVLRSLFCLLTHFYTFAHCSFFCSSTMYLNLLYMIHFMWFRYYFFSLLATTPVLSISRSGFL